MLASLQTERLHGSAPVLQVYIALTRKACWDRVWHVIICLPPPQQQSSDVRKGVCLTLKLESSTHNE